MIQTLLMHAPVVADFLDDIVDDLADAFVNIYTDQMGMAFWALGILAMLIPIHNRVGTIPVIIIGLFMWGTFAVMVPSDAWNLGSSLIILIGGILLAAIFIRLRSVR